MRTLTKKKLLAPGVVLVLLAAGCSSLPGQSESGKEMAATGPTIINPRVEPSTIELNRDLQPRVPPEVLADVKDFRAPVTQVKLKFLHVPIQIPMKKMDGTTWKAELTPEQLQMLAVSGKTIKYDAAIVAKDEKGQVAISQNPITIAIKTADLSTASY